MDNEQQGQEAPVTDSIDSLPDWAQKLIKELRDEAAKHRVKAKTAEEKAALEAERLQKEALAKQGEFEQLYNKTAAELEAEKAFRKRAGLLEEKISATNTSRIERIPEGMRSVIPTDYPPEKLSEWLDANERLLTKADPPPRDGGRTGDNGHVITPKLTDVQIEMAKQAGLTPAEYAKYMTTAAATELSKP